jgi:hypothetical protein
MIPDISNSGYVNKYSIEVHYINVHTDRHVTSTRSVREDGIVFPNYSSQYVIEIGYLDNNNRILFKRHIFNLMEVVKLSH